MSTEQRQTLDLGNAGRELVLACTGASEISSIERVQTLWSGYGDIARVRLAYSGIPRIRKRTSVVVKYIHPPYSAKSPTRLAL